MVLNLGYGVRDFFYYKRRCGNTLATLNDIRIESDATAMIESNANEREVRIVLSKIEVRERNVAITPLKNVSNTSEDEEVEDLDQVNEYKQWLAYMHRREQAMGKFCCCHLLLMIFAMHC